MLNPKIAPSVPYVRVRYSSNVNGCFKVQLISLLANVSETGENLGGNTLQIMVLNLLYMLMQNRWR